MASWSIHVVATNQDSVVTYNCSALTSSRTVRGYRIHMHDECQQSGNLSYAFRTLFYYSTYYWFPTYIYLGYMYKDVYCAAYRTDYHSGLRLNIPKYLDWDFILFYHRFPEKQLVKTTSVGDTAKIVKCTVTFKAQNKEITKEIRPNLDGWIYALRYWYCDQKPNRRLLTVSAVFIGSVVFTLHNSAAHSHGSLFPKL